MKSEAIAIITALAIGAVVVLLYVFSGSVCPLFDWIGATFPDWLTSLVFAGGLSAGIMPYIASAGEDIASAVETEVLL